MAVLDCVYRLGPPGAYVAAGFVRNLVWDALHDKGNPTPLNDVDVIYFDPNETEPDQHLRFEKALQTELPNIHWQVRNQARMHERNGDPPYANIVDAMSYWPEKETAIAVRLTSSGDIDCVSAFGLDSLFQLCISHNPKRAWHIFDQRVQSKGWLDHWPKLTISSKP